MSIQSEINRLKAAIADSYTQVAEKGGALPQNQNADNLPAAIQGIPADGNSFHGYLDIDTNNVQLIEYYYESFGQIYTETLFSNGETFAEFDLNVFGPFVIVIYAKKEGLFFDGEGCPTITFQSGLNLNSNAYVSTTYVVPTEEEFYLAAMFEEEDDEEEEG